MSECESIETSNSDLTSPSWDSVLTFKYDADDEEVVITHGSQLGELSICKNLQNSDTCSDNYQGDIEEGPVTDFEEWTQDDLTVSSIHVSESSDELDLSILDPKDDPYLEEDFLFNGNKIWLHSKKLRLIERKYRRRAFPIITDSSSDSDTTSSKPVAPTYRPDVKGRSKARGLLDRLVDVFSCCFGF